MAYKTIANYIRYIQRQRDYRRKIKWCKKENENEEVRKVVKKTCKRKEDDKDKIFKNSQG